MPLEFRSVITAQEKKNGLAKPKEMTQPEGLIVRRTT